MSDAAATATVDTSVVISAIDESDADSVELFRRAIRGDFDLAVTTRVWSELTKSEPSAGLRAYLERTAPIGAPARYGMSTYGGGDYWAGPQDNAAGANMDGDHVAGHIRSGRAVFISRDGRQLRRARKAGADAVTPSEFLARFPAR